jgi:hypothetical protein
MGKDHTNRVGTNNANSEWTEEDDSLASIEEFCNPTEVLIFFTLPFFVLVSSTLVLHCLFLLFAKIILFFCDNQNTVLNGNNFDKALIEFYMKNVSSALTWFPDCYI